MEYFHQILLAYTFLHCLDTGIQNKDKASLSISVTGNGKLVKMRITLEPHGLFLSKFANSLRAGQLDSIFFQPVR